MVENYFILFRNSRKYFDHLRNVLCIGTQEEFGGSQLGGALPTRTQEGGGTQLEWSQGHKRI
jgi:hypothetical protein